MVNVSLTSLAGKRGDTSGEEEQEEQEEEVIVLSRPGWRRSSDVPLPSRRRGFQRQGCSRGTWKPSRRFGQRRHYSHFIGLLSLHFQPRKMGLGGGGRTSRQRRSG